MLYIKVKKKFNLTNVIAVNSCTNGLHAALLACGIDEKDEVIKEAKEILDVENVVASILLVEDLRIQKN